MNCNPNLITSNSYLILHCHLNFMYFPKNRFFDFYIASPTFRNTVVVDSPRNSCELGSVSAAEFFALSFVPHQPTQKTYGRGEGHSV